jgi:hypothetical protein
MAQNDTRQRELPHVMTPPNCLNQRGDVLADSNKQSKPEKPYPEFPLFAHATRRWAKKILGKFHYFGPWGDWQGALTKF